MGTNGISSGLINVDILPTPGNGGTGSATNVAPIKLINDEMEAERKAKLTTAPTLDPSAITKRSENELYKSFRSVCIKAGFNPSDAELERIISVTTSGQTTKALLNIDQAELNRYLKCLEQALQDSTKNADGNYNTEAIAQLAQKYQIGTLNGVFKNIDDFKKRDKVDQSRSITKKMNDFYHTNWTMEEKVKKYFTKYYAEFAEKKLEGITDPVEREKKIARITEILTQDLYGIVANSDSEEIPLIREALKAVNNSGLQIHGIDLMLAACDTKEQRSDAALDTLTDEEFMGNLHNATEEPDALGQILTTDAHDTAVIKLMSALDDTDQAEYHEYFNNNKKEFYKTYEAIKLKIEKGEELTPEEQAFFEKAEKEKKYLTRMSANEHIGVATSTVLSDINNTLKVLHKDALEYDDCREVYSQINDYIQNKVKTGELNSDEVKEFTEMMNQATNGNYEIILKDIKDGTTSELNPPLEPKAETNTSSTNNTGLAIDVKEKVTESPLTEKQKQSLIESQNKEIKDAESKARKARRSGDESKAEGIMYTATVRAIKNYAVNGFTFSEIIENIGCTRNEGIVYAYENQNILSGKFIEGAKDTFKNLDVKEKANFIAKHDIKAYNFIASELTLEELKYFEAEKIGSSTLQAIISNRIETFDKNNIEE